MPPHSTSDEMFSYVRVMLSIVTGLGLTLVLQGLARFIQHPKQNKVYLPHLLWSFALTLRLLHFWWFEHGLVNVRAWTFEIYLLVVGFGIVNFLLCTLLYPSDLTDYKGYREYFLSRKNWFFGLMIASFAIDFYDSMVKGADYLADLGAFYFARAAIVVVLCLVGIFTKSERFQYYFAGGYLLLQLYWIFGLFER